MLVEQIRIFLGSFTAELSLNSEINEVNSLKIFERIGFKISIDKSSVQFHQGINLITVTLVIKLNLLEVFFHYTISIPVPLTRASVEVFVTQR